MDFKKATDGLFDRIDHEELARALGVSVATVRQARLNENAKARRNPPKNWEIVVSQIAKERIANLQALVLQLESDIASVCDHSPVRAFTGEGVHR